MFDFGLVVPEGYSWWPSRQDAQQQAGMALGQDLGLGVYDPHIGVRENARNGIFETWNTIPRDIALSARPHLLILSNSADWGPSIQTYEPVVIVP